MIEIKTINVDRLAFIASKGKVNELTDKQRKDIENWGKEYESTVKAELTRIYEQDYQEQLQTAIDLFLVAIKYTLHFNDKCNFGQKRLNDVMQDILATVNGFQTHEFNVVDYIKMLNDDKIITGFEDYFKIENGKVIKK